MILSEDVLDFLANLPDESTDLIIADPPYGIEKSFGVKQEWRDIEGWVTWCDKWLLECERIMKPGAGILVYGIHHYICYNQVSLYSLGLDYRRQIIWHYENGFCGNRKLRATYEPLLWFTKGDRYYFEEVREPYKSADRLKYPVRKGGKVWKPHPKGRIAGDVWSIPTLAGRRFRDEKVDHPSQKPMVLSQRLARHFCPKSGSIVIPFAGSGSECLAAFREGRRFLATEINPAFRRLALSRLKAEGWEPDLDQCRPAASNKTSGDRLTVAPAPSAVNQ